MEESAKERDDVYKPRLVWPMGVMNAAVQGFYLMEGKSLE